MITDDVSINLERLPIFDTHAHYDDKAFFDDIYLVVEKMSANGVIGAINCGCNYTSSKRCLDLADKFNIFYSAVGVHPEDIPENGCLNTEALRKLTDHKSVVAIGEIGLDYYWDKSNRDAQIKWFTDQVLFANQVGLPVIVHDRDAHNDTLNILKSTNPKGVVHCFSGSAEMAKEILKLGIYIGVGGVVTFKNARKLVEVVQMLPLDRLLLETDAPYLSPVPFRGTRCTSDFIYYTACKIAEIKGISTEEVVNASLKNTKELFNIIK